MKGIITALVAILCGVLLGAYTTPVVEGQYGYQTTSTLSGLLTTDGTDIDLASGQFTLPAGTAAAPTLAFEADSGLYLVAADNIGMSVGGALVMDWENTNAAGASANLVTISGTLGAMDGSEDTVRGLYINPTSAGHSAGNYDALSIGNVTGTSAAEVAITVGTGYDDGFEILSTSSDSILINDTTATLRFANGVLAIGDDNGVTLPVLSLNNFPDAVGDFADTYMVGVGDGSDTIAAMDGSDTYSMFEIDFTNADHTGSTNVLNGIFIDDIAGDAEATEHAIYIEGDVSGQAQWDNGIMLDDADIVVAGDAVADAALVFRTGPTGTTIAEVGKNASNNLHTVLTSGYGFEITGSNIATTGRSIALLTFTANAMDDAGDITTGLNVDFTNGDHTNGVLNGILIDDITGDAEATENAINIEDGWDYDVNFTGTDAIVGIPEGHLFVRRTNDSTNRLVIPAAQEVTVRMGDDLAVVGATQNVDPSSWVVEASAGAAADIATITPPLSNHTARITFVCVDANLTFTDSDAAGAANTLNLAGAATDFTCSADDTITFAWVEGIAAGNDRWVEVARSVN
jgi:hypothetical protein